MKRYSPRQIEALEAVAEGRFLPAFVREDDGWHARWRGVGDDNPWIDDFVREATVTPLCADAEDQRHDTLHDAWLAALRSRTGLVRRDDTECEAFRALLERWSDGIDSDASARAAFEFRLVTDEKTIRVECEAPTGKAALKALGQAAFVFRPLAFMRLTPDAAASGRRTISADLSTADAESFVRSAAKSLSDAGYKVSGADVASTISAEAEIVEVRSTKYEVRSEEGTLKLKIHVAGQEVGEDEIRFLIDQKSSLVFFRDRWIEVDRSILKEALRALERQNGRSLTRNEALAFASGIGFAGRIAANPAKAHGWLRGLVNELRRTAGGDLLDVAMPDLNGAELRGYQRRGVAWMKFLTDHGFGALLADDMGLGKTIQTIAWILLERGAVVGRFAPKAPPPNGALRATRPTTAACGQAALPNAQTPKPILIVAPLTLLANWRREFAKFAPSLRVAVHQGAGRLLETGFRRMAAGTDVVLTSYSMLVKDWRVVRSVEWSALVLDEAQAVKNPATRAARAAVALGAPKRIALTGTPVENSVADVWSLENFLNPGFLGDARTFAEKFAKPMAADEKSAAGKRLAHALEPFVLRRLKSDAAVAGELGPKREIKEYCVLSASQRREYEDALEEYRAGERRRGDVFALLTRLKLVCDGEGKFARLFDLLDGVFAAGESALVFTQYAKVGARIAEALKERFGRSFPFLHGALTAAEREREVERFEAAGPSAFVLSLRAGGFGLNLVKATHVVHFDRWWNPAVEAQATDRAHRIGQRGTVFVHSFITEGTLEERVDELLERKSRVAGNMVQSGENFLRELSPEEFEEVVRLG